MLNSEALSKLHPFSEPSNSLSMAVMQLIEKQFSEMIVWGRWESSVSRFCFWWYNFFEECNNLRTCEREWDKNPISRAQKGSVNFSCWTFLKISSSSVIYQMLWFMISGSSASDRDTSNPPLCFEISLGSMVGFEATIYDGYFVIFSCPFFFYFVLHFNMNC